MWNYKDPEVDKLLDLARQTESAEERKQIYMKFQAHLVEKPVSVIAYHRSDFVPYRKDIKGLAIYPLLLLDFREATIGK